MLIKKRTGIEIPSSEITPEFVYLSRRQFMRGAALSTAAVAAGGLLAACSAPEAEGTENIATGSAAEESVVQTAMPGSVSATTDELGDPLNSFEEITTYNNYYEFSTNKEAVAPLAKDFPTAPWQVEVGGLVNKPKTFGLEDLLAFEHMPGVNSPLFPWPYVEGLRLDEAMNNLAILSTGLYGKALLPQNGAPIRLVVPWKYGFKSIKSIVKIDLVDTMPQSLWMKAAPNEYGFFATVNPNVDHPRWSQATERRIGEFGRRETLLFNGYGEQVAHMYDDPNYDTTQSSGIR